VRADLVLRPAFSNKFNDLKRSLITLELLNSSISYKDIFMDTEQTVAGTKRVSRDMTIQEILNLFPDKAQRLAYEITKVGLHCVGCHAADSETLEAGMYTHGKSDEEIDRFVNVLNKLLDEKSDATTVAMTARAVKKYTEILESEGKAGWGVRLDEELAGCSGFEYVLDYSEKPSADDVIFESNGMQIHVRKAILSHMLGIEIDYIDGLHGSGFKISNPNVKSSCGCGSSHNY